MNEAEISAPRIALVLNPLSDENLGVATAIGATDVVFYNMDTVPSLEVLMAARRLVEGHGLRLTAVEGGPTLGNVLRGESPGREEEIAEFQDAIRRVAASGARVFCYNLMQESFRVWRTSYQTPCRGGRAHALTSSFFADDFDDSPRYPHEVPAGEEERLWANIKLFLDAVVPVAEECGVYLSCHPDDPPCTLRGLARVMTSLEAFERLLALHPSSHNTITFCQGCFSEMGVDIPAAIRRIGRHVTFVHFRDVQGCADNFVETFPDEGQTDMPEAIRAWKEVGFSGIIRPDHVPLFLGLDKEGMDEDGKEKARGYPSGKASGYTVVGRIFAVGYLRGLLQAVYGKEAGSARAAGGATTAAIARQEAQAARE